MREIYTTYYKQKNKKSLYTDNRKYQIFISSGKRKFFGDKKKAEKFLAELNRKFTTIIDELINITVSVYLEIWNFWLLYEDTKTEKLFDAVKNIEFFIHKTIVRANQNNSDSIYFIIQNIKSACAEITDICTQIIKKNKDTNRHGNNRRVKVILKHIKSIEKEIDSI